MNVCPRSDAQYALGEGVSAFQKALDHGMRPGFSIDNEVSYGTDMFTEMRVAFNVQRAMATYRKAHGDAKAPALVSVRAGARVRDGSAAPRAPGCSTNAGRSRPARRRTSS